LTDQSPCRALGSGTLTIYAREGRGDRWHASMDFKVIAVGLDRLDAELFALMILSRVNDRRRRRRFAPPLTRSSTRTQCHPSDQGRFIGRAYCYPRQSAPVLLRFLLPPIRIDNLRPRCEPHLAMRGDIIQRPVEDPDAMRHAD